MKIRYVRFARRPDSDQMPHPVFIATTIQTGIYLGKIRFVPSWRKFVFDPSINTPPYCLLDVDRLREIADFIDTIPTQERHGGITDAEIFG